jgi:hypothetical protein
MPKKTGGKAVAQAVAQAVQKPQGKTANKRTTVWKPKEPAAAAPAADGAPALAADAPGPSAEPPKKHRKVSLCGLLGGRIKKEASPAAPAAVRDELDQYLEEPVETDLDVDVLAWWKAKESKWPALAKMVKQYFAAPASSAGVERVFSAAGKMHGDLQKSAKDSTLEHSLFAAFNTD